MVGLEPEEPSIHQTKKGPLEHVVEIRFGEEAHPDNLKLILSLAQAHARVNASVIAPGADIRSSGMRFVVQLKRRRLLELKDPLEER